MAKKPSDLVTLTVRLREALRRQLEKAAKAHDCSMNTEIIVRLMRSFEREEREARDTAIVDAFARGKAHNRFLISGIVAEVAENPEWFATPEGVEAMAARIDHHLRAFGPKDFNYDYDEEDEADHQRHERQIEERMKEDRDE
jgi:hypothetical protein